MFFYQFYKASSHNENIKVKRNFLTRLYRTDKNEKTAEVKAFMQLLNLQALNIIKLKQNLKSSL